MNAYDFDNTVLRGDSTARFMLYCLARHPALWPLVPGQLLSGAMYLMGKKDRRVFKEGLFTAVLPRLADPAGEIDAFWAKNLARIKPFYYKNHRPDDAVITASPEFLVRPACEKLGVAVCIGSPVDMRTGRYRGENCHGAEKVRRFREMFPDARVEKFFSDSHSDDPMAILADEAVLVRGTRLLPWKRARRNKFWIRQKNA